MLLEPVLVGLDRQCPYQPQAALAIGEDAHDMGASLELLVQPLDALVTGMKIAVSGVRLGPLRS